MAVALSRSRTRGSANGFALSLIWQAFKLTTCRVFAGRIKPNDEKLFVTISEIGDDEKKLACEWGEYGVAYDVGAHYTNTCLANYKIEFSASFGFFNASTDTYRFGSDLSHFSLYGTGEFVLFRTSYVTHGRCEKIN
jgi:hypothetical protein